MALREGAPNGGSSVWYWPPPLLQIDNTKCWHAYGAKMGIASLRLTAVVYCIIAPLCTQGQNLRSCTPAKCIFTIKEYVKTAACFEVVKRASARRAESAPRCVMR
jgi:hypothetical protein